MSRPRLLLTILVLVCLIVSGIFVVRGIIQAQQSSATDNISALDQATPAPGGSSATTRLLAQTPSALTATKVLVPASMRSDPFTIDRTLNIPSGMSISVYARI